MIVLLNRSPHKFTFTIDPSKTAPVDLPSHHMHAAFEELDRDGMVKGLRIVDRELPASVSIAPGAESRPLPDDVETYSQVKRAIEAGVLSVRR